MVVGAIPINTHLGACCLKPGGWAPRCPAFSDGSQLVDSLCPGPPSIQVLLRLTLSYVLVYSYFWAAGVQSYILI